MTGILEQSLARVHDEFTRQQRVASYMHDPVLWATGMLGPDAYVWSKQQEILRSVIENKNTVVKAGHGVGKSFISALMVAWWVDTRYPNCFIATTAPSVSQISSILWREIK